MSGRRRAPRRAEVRPRGRARCGAAAVAALALLGVAAGATVPTPEPREVGPDADWCAALNDLEPGGELRLLPGDYAGPCTIRRGGIAGAPTVLRAADPEAPPRIRFTGSHANVLSVRAGHVTIRDLRFGPTLPEVDAIRVHAVEGVTVENCRFEDLGGIAVVSNSGSHHGLTVRGNHVVNTRATAMYFGCHDGLKCAVTGLVVERNHIEGVTSYAIGYGIQVKLNSAGIIRDNVIVDTKGPGIMVYGGRDPGTVSVVERNFVARSRTSSAIVIGGGPAIVRNNILVGSAEAGIGLEDYGHRALLRGIVVAHNTLYGNAGGGIVAPADGPLEARVVNNAVHAPAGSPLFPFGRVGVLALGNADCAVLRCFVDPLAGDFSLIAPRWGVTLGEGWVTHDDYARRPRGAPPLAGALEGPAAPAGGPKPASP
jgi:hypothetical protein